MNYVLVKDSRWGGYLCFCYVYALLQAPVAHYLLLSVVRVCQWSTSLQHTHEHQSYCNHEMQCCHTCSLKQVEKSFFQNEGRYRDGLKHQKGTNHQRGHYTAKMDKATEHYPYIFVLLFISKIYMKHLVHLCCVMTPSFSLFEEMMFPLV